MKVYAKRDYALAALRRAGVAKEHYDQHLKKVDTGFVLENLPAPAAKSAPAKTGKKERAAKGPRVSVASTIRELIRAGKTNEQIWAIVKPKFGLDDQKKHYPGWYRSELNRKEGK